LLEILDLAIKNGRNQKIKIIAADVVRKYMKKKK
jgi:hypothetical protein